MNFITLAQSAGITLQSGDAENLQKFVMSHMQHAYIRGCRDGAIDEREDCAKILDEMANYMESEMEPSETVAWVRSKAASIRARGNNAS